MGIQGLLPLLKDVAKPVHVSAYSGKTLGVDAYVWLHRGAYGCAREIVLGDPTPRYIAHALGRIRMLQHFGVKPYLVFDGDKLPAKKGTEDDRESRRAENLAKAQALEDEGKTQQARDLYGKCVDITPEMAYQLIKVLKQEGIPYVVAPYEADAQLAYLEAEGVIDGVVTEDSDLLVFGCKKVLFKLDQAGNAVEMLQERFWTNRGLALSGWTAVEFRQMAILSGCDYLPSIVGMGLKNAHRLLRRYKTVDKVLQAVRLEGKMRVPPTYSREFRKAELTFVHQRVWDPRSGKMVTLTPLPDGTHDEMLPFIGAAMHDEIARGIAEGVVDPIAKTPIVDRVPKPLAVRSSSASNVASASANGASHGGAHTLHRSTTAPTNMYSAGGSSNSFYRASVGASSSSGFGAKKKVVSKEAGLQSLKNFFGGAATSSKVKVESTQAAKTQERVPFAPRDTNRPSNPFLEPKKEDKPTQSKFFARPASTPTKTTQQKSLLQSQDHAYLHLGGQLTPPKARQDPNDSGYWDDECDDLHDFVKSSSPPQATPALGGGQDSQSLVMDTQELWQDSPLDAAALEIKEGAGVVESVVTTQAESSSSGSGQAKAMVVVPQTPSRGTKRSRMHSGALTECVSSPESGFISSPASSSVRGGGVGEDDMATAGMLMAEEDADTLPSSPTLPCRLAQEFNKAKREGVEDEEDEVVAEPVTPVPLVRGLSSNGGGSSTRKPMLHTSASMSKLEAFRYHSSSSLQTPQPNDKRATLPRRSTTTTTALAADENESPSLLKLTASTPSLIRSTTATSGRPNKVLKRSPTLVFGGQEDENASGASSGGGLFERFRFSEEAGSGSGSRHVSF